jgi:hypothetical protein
VLKLVKLGLGDSTEDVVSWVKLTSLMDRSVMSGTKARIFYIASRGFLGLGPADLGEVGKVFFLKGGQNFVHFPKYC